MAIPQFDDHGRLPAGVHDCTLAEIIERFGQFQDSDERCRLVERLEKFIGEARLSNLIAAVIVDGSFVTATSHPNDIDLIVVVAHGHDFHLDLRPFEYNLLSRRRVQRFYGFDILVAEEGEVELLEYIDFFAQVRGRPGEQKGMLRIVL